MDSATTAITKLYQLDPVGFDARMQIMATNIKRQLLEDFVRAPNFVPDDAEHILAGLSAALIQTQKTACNAADITGDQHQDFENRIDSILAEAIITIRDCFAAFDDRTSVAFQLETAKQLNIPVA